MASKDKKVQVRCQYCGNILETSYHLAHKPRFCSQSCKGKTFTGENNPNWKGGLVQRFCETCGKEFYAKQKDVRKRHKRFCSRKCWGQWRSKHFKGENGCNWQGGGVEKTCPNCSGKFVVSPSRNKQNATYCSYRCLYEHKRGERHHAWRGGPEPYPPEWTEQFREIIRKRDNYTCAICGENDSRCVHHVDYDKENCHPDNLITLCNPCHSKTNVNRQFWTALFADIIEQDKSTENERIPIQPRLF